MTPRRFIGMCIANFANTINRVAYRLAQKAPSAGDRAWHSLTRLAARVSDCGCDHEEAENCGSGEWCECKCHKENEAKS